MILVESQPKLIVSLNTESKHSQKRERQVRHSASASLHSELINWHETHWPHLTHHNSRCQTDANQPARSLESVKSEPGNVSPDRRQLIIRSTRKWVLQSNSIIVQHLWGSVDGITANDHARSTITIRGKQLLVLFCPPSNPKYPEKEQQVPVKNCCDIIFAIYCIVTAVHQCLWR